MISCTTIRGKPFYYLTERRFKTRKGMAELVGAGARGDDTLLSLKYDTGEYEDILISKIVQLCKLKGIEIKKV